METMMVLTKNIVAEATLQERLQTLGYEVYVSSNALQKLLRTACCLDIAAFDFLLISSTVSDEESQQILKELPPEGPHVFRLDDGQLTEDEQDRWTQLGVTSCLTSESSLKALREMFTSSSVRPDRKLIYEEAEYSYPVMERQISSFVSSLSKKERKVFNALYQVQGEVLPRQKLAEQVWKNSVTSSNLAQLSQIVNRIRKKYRKHNFPDALIETHWRFGYQLSSDIFPNLNDKSDQIPS